MIPEAPVPPPGQPQPSALPPPLPASALASPSASTSTSTSTPGAGGRVPPVLPSAIPPLLPPGWGSQPPRLPPPRKKARPPLPTWRRWARIVVWTTLAVVVFLRLKFPPDPEFRRNAGWNQGNGNWNQGPGWERPRTRVTPAVSLVPDDLWRIEMEIAPDGVEKLRGHQRVWRGRRIVDNEDRPEVLARIRQGGREWTNVSVHLKGAAGSFRPFDDKPAFTLNFSKEAKGQRFHQFAKVSLNNSVQDHTYLCEALCRELYLASGVPVPVASHATLLVNGRDLGMYVVTEGWGKPFLRQHFDQVEGNLYDGGFVQDIDGALTVVSGKEQENHAALERLAALVQEGSRAGRWKRLQEVLDTDRFITLLALDVLICNWDGYALNRNNYRVFHDQKTGRFVFMPHGMDQVFGTGGRMDPHSTILPPMQGMVARAVLSTPEGRAKYLARLQELQSTVFQEERLTQRVKELSAQILPTLEAYGTGPARQHQFAVADLTRRIGERCESVRAQLAEPRPQLQFDAHGEARLAEWKPRPGRTPGVASFGREPLGEQQLLTIELRQGPGSGSWRTRVVLDPGTYRFEGRVRVQSSSPDAAVCLRLSGSPVNRIPAGTDDWIPLVCRWEVEEPLTELELIAEMVGSSGQAGFDASSLRIIREQGGGD